MPENKIWKRNVPRRDSRAPYDRHDNRGRPYPGDRGGSYGGRAGGMGGGGYGAMDYGPPMDLTRMAMVPMLLPNGQVGMPDFSIFIARVR